jgi:Ca2+:H+ antiporter
MTDRRETLSSSPEPLTALASDGVHTVGTAATAQRSSVESAPNADATPVANAQRPPPFSRKVTKSLFIRPASQRVCLSPSCLSTRG